MGPGSPLSPVIIEKLIILLRGVNAKKATNKGGDASSSRRGKHSQHRRCVNINMVMGMVM